MSFTAIHSCVLPLISEAYDLPANRRDEEVIGLHTVPLKDRLTTATIRVRKITSLSDDSGLGIRRSNMPISLSFSHAEDLIFIV